MDLIHSNFDFLDRPWWKADYDERDVQYYITEIKRLQKAIKKSVVADEDEKFILGYIQLHQENYLIECISAESDVSHEKVKQLLKDEPNCDPHSLRLAKKVQNLNNVVKDIFPSIFFPNLSMDRFTPSFAKELHQQIGDNGLIDNAGQYRTNFVKPAQDDFYYMDPKFINDELEKLFGKCREIFGREDLQLEEAVKFSACFLAYFLYVHPFSNGNGRVARLLLSYLLSNFTVVPLSLYTGTETRNNYLQCLREAQWYHDPPFKPSALATFILENVHKTSYHICTSMDIDYSE